MTPPDATLSVFISHSHEDQDFGIRLVQDLRAFFSKKEAIWFDTAGGLSGGMVWRPEIVDQVTKRPVFIVILSPDAISSKWVSFELNMAWVLMLSSKDSPSKLIVPLLYRPSTLSADLNTLQVISFLPSTSYEAGLDELIAAINRFASAHGYAPIIKPSPLTQMDEEKASFVSQKTKEQWLIEGHSHYFARRYAEALAAYEQALQLDPTFAEAYNGKGRAYYFLARYHEALASFEQAIRLKPDYVDPLMKDLQGSLKQESAPGLTADQFTSISLSTESIYRHDLLLVLLKEKLHLNNFSIIGGSIAFAAAYFGLSPLTGISFGLRGAALVHTLSAFLQTFLVVPLLYSLYLQIPTSITGFFNTLIVNGVISEHRPDRPGSESFVTFLQNFTARVDNSWLIVSASLMAGSYLLYRFLMDAVRPGHPSFWLEAVAFLVIYFPLLYATLISMLQLLITLISTNSLFT
jgi:tetratricopeptide (TPR) repeat protein